ncbi:MAG: hypothetical protein K6U03_01165 [Firmicutes bacterium]|nr:hypothetical protein [Bacillota bacterium]
MDKSIKRVSSIILGLIIIILINIPITGADEDQLALYQNKKYQIEALYPKSWEIAEETFGVQVMFISPFENSDDKFRENVNIVIKELEQTAADLEAISQASIEQISQLITDFKLISYEKVQFSGYESRLIIYSGKQGIFKLKFLQVLVIRNNILYVITFTAQEEAFNRYLPAATTIIDSFKIKGK